MKMVIRKKRDEKAEVETASTIVNNAPVSEAEHAEMHEVVSQRGQRSKVFTGGNGKMRAEFYDVPVHYLGESEELIPVDIRLNDDGEVFETRKNAFKARFHKHPKDGKIFEMEKDLCKVGLKLMGAENCCNATAEVCECDEVDCNCSKVLVKNAANDTDIEYIVDAEKIKENIIVKSRADKYEYDFSLALDNLAVGVSEDGKRLELTKKDSGRLEFYIPAPIMFDANGVESDAVYYEIDEDSTDTLKLRVIASSEWINANERVFPITIDPQIATAQWSGAYYTSSAYQQSIFRYTVIDEQGNEKTENPRVYSNYSQRKYNHTKITILKSLLPEYARNSFRKVLLRLRAMPGSKVSSYTAGNNQCRANVMNFDADITDIFTDGGNPITVDIMANGGRSDLSNNDIRFFPPSLVIEYENDLKSMSVTTAPTKKVYISGEAFNPAGMVVTGRFADNSTKAISHGDLLFYPTGSLATYDRSVTIRHRDYENIQTSVNITVKNGEYWFNDRRVESGMENVYKMTVVNANGEPQSSTQSYVRLELSDGVGDDANKKGTPLNAETFNKIINVLKEKGILT